MYIVEGIVLYRNLPNPLLSFRSTQQFENGSIITVSLRSADVFFLVLSSSHIRERKLSIKSSDFELKPIPLQTPHGIISPAALDVFMSESKKYNIPLHQIISKKIIERHMSEISLWVETPFVSYDHEYKNITLLHGDILEEYEQSQIIICPSVLYLLTLHHKLLSLYDDEIEIINMYGGSNAHDKKTYEEFLHNQNTQRLIILTTSSFIPSIPTHLCIVRVIEPENIFHHDNDLKFSHIDLLLQTSSQPVVVYGLTADICISSNDTYIISSKEDKKTEYVSTAHAVIPKKVLGLLSKDIKAHKTIGIFSLQTSYSSAIFCTTCKKVARCSSCDAKVHKHKNGSKITYMCHAEKKVFIPWDACQYCSALSLIELGLGTGQLEEYLLAYFEQVKIFRLDAFKETEDKLSPKKVSTLIEDVSLSGGIILGSLKAFLSSAQTYDALYIFDYDRLVFSSGTLPMAKMLSLMFLKTSELYLISEDPTLAPTPEDLLQEALVI